jgi:prepilin-type processing-associated H-X9-DG protein
MEADPQEAGYLYVDGHVRVYHGDSCPGAMFRATDSV